MNLAVSTTRVSRDRQQSLCSHRVYKVALLNLPYI